MNKINTVMMKNKIEEILKNSYTNFGEFDESKATKELLVLFGVYSSFQGYYKEETFSGKRCKDICDKPQCGW